jgi:hypothetical protein
MAKTKSPKPKGKKPSDVELDGKITAYCVSCRKKNQAITDPVLTFTAVQGKWKPMVQGQHSCGTKMTRFVNQDFVDEVMA